MKAKPGNNPYNNCFHRAILENIDLVTHCPHKLGQYFDVGQYSPVLPSKTVIIGLEMIKLV